jgi:hypothetical protein
VVEFEEVVGCLVITTDDYGEDRSVAFSGVVFVEVAEMAILARYGHAIEITLIADSLGVTHIVNIENARTTKRMLTWKSPQMMRISISKILFPCVWHFTARSA